MRGDALDLGTVGQLMPMHLVLDAEGGIISGGPTLRKLIGDARSIDEAFGVERPHPGHRSPAEALNGAAQTGERIFLRQLEAPCAVLRGHAVRASDGRLILNLGFGIGLPQSIRQLNLTDADFAPSDLAMELLFLHEANAAAMSALSRYNAQLDHARLTAMAESATDPLTGLANRRGLEAALARAARPLAQGPETEGRRPSDPCGFAVLQLDLDGFKAVNDTHGHAVGDLLLQHVATILQGETRANDTVARPGGDEFVLVVGAIASEEALATLAQRIIARIEEPVVLGDARIRISTSIGIAPAAGVEDPDPETLLVDADAALYAAKRGGRGCAFMVRAPGLQPEPVTEPAPPITFDDKVVALAVGRAERGAG